MATFLASTEGAGKNIPPLSRSIFPKDFVFGAGSAAYQVRNISAPKYEHCMFPKITLLFYCIDEMYPWKILSTGQYNLVMDDIKKLGFEFQLYCAIFITLGQKYMNIWG